MLGLDEEIMLVIFNINGWWWSYFLDDLFPVFASIGGGLVKEIVV